MASPLMHAYGMPVDYAELGGRIEGYAETRETISELYQSGLAFFRRRRASRRGSENGIDIINCIIDAIRQEAYQEKVAQWKTEQAHVSGRCRIAEHFAEDELIQTVHDNIVFDTVLAKRKRIGTRKEPLEWLRSDAEDRHGMEIGDHLTHYEDNEFALARQTFTKDTGLDTVFILYKGEKTVHYVCKAYIVIPGVNIPLNVSWKDDGAVSLNVFVDRPMRKMAVPPEPSELMLDRFREVTSLLDVCSYNMELDHVKKSPICKLEAMFCEFGFPETDMAPDSEEPDIDFYDREAEENKQEGEDGQQENKKGTRAGPMQGGLATNKTVAERRQQDKHDYPQAYALCCMNLHAS